MQALMPKLWEEYEKHLDATDDPALDMPEGFVAGGRAFLDFATKWLNTNLSRDFLIITPQGQQFLLTDRIGGSDLPTSYAIHAIGEAVPNHQGSGGGIAITK